MSGALKLNLALQFFLQFAKEAPVGPLRNDLLWTRLDHPGLVEAEGVEADRILRVVLSPLGVRELLDELNGVVEARGVAAIHHEPRDAVRLKGADVGTLENRPHRSLRCDRILTDELSVPCDDTAKVLRPGSVHRAVDDDITNLPHSQLL